MLDEDGADPAPPDQAAAAPAVQVATTAVDPLLAIRPPVPPPAPEAATEAEVPDGAGRRRDRAAAGHRAPAGAATAASAGRAQAAAAVPAARPPRLPRSAGDGCRGGAGVDQRFRPSRNRHRPRAPRRIRRPLCLCPVRIRAWPPPRRTRAARRRPDARARRQCRLAAERAARRRWRRRARWRRKRRSSRRRWPAQITLAVGRAVDRQVEIRLDPPELGRVHIQLTPTEQGLQAVVMAERPETHDLLRRHAEVLTKDLNAAGYDNVSLDFAAGGRDTARDGERRGPEHSFGLASGQAVAAVAPGRPAPGARPTARSISASDPKEKPMDVTSTGTATTPAASTTKTATTEQPTATSTLSGDFNTFLKLLTTQLENQDPLQPMDSTEFIAQLASFSSVEQQIGTNTRLDEMLSVDGRVLGRELRDLDRQGGPGADQRRVRRAARSMSRLRRLRIPTARSWW